LRAGDLLVVNTSATIPGELDATLAGAAIVVHVAAELPDRNWVVELRSFPDAAAPLLDGHIGDRIDLPGDAGLELVAPYPAAGSSPTGQGNRLWRAAATGVTGRLGYLDRFGRPISYGYLAARYPLSDYQTVFAATPGSAEMASAARPFTPELVAQLTSRGVVIAPILLHTGVSSQDAGEAPQAEYFEVSRVTADRVNLAKRTGGRVIAVGTTATRAIESATGADGRVRPARGWTELVIGPDRPVRAINGLITGWHNPDASHLLLVESVAGAQLTQAAYDAAVAAHYRWHEFGDSCLLLPDPTSRARSINSI
jgi:S-adenosylmethionine:tRNA ribosyltransferase-isomerase